MSFDLSAIISEAALEVWVEYADGFRVKVRHITREKLADLTKQAQTKSWDRQHQPVSEFDAIKFGELLGVAAVVDWDGATANGAPLPCTADNIRLLMRRWVDFARFISDISTDLERLVAVQRDEERKNSASTSGVVSITPGSPAASAA